MIIYTPIYLHEEIGFGWNEIGTIFSIMLLPFVILTFPLGKMSDSVGEKKMLKIGFLISAISTFFIPFISIKTVWIFALILFITRVGASIIEAMSEIYFFKIISEENADVISFFKNTYPLSFVVAPLVATVLLFFLPHFSYLFPILSIILFLGLMLTLRLRDVK
jgi:MFS family permease